MLYVVKTTTFRFFTSVRLFGELMLTFGGFSSAGIYDILAKLIRDLATISSDTDTNTDKVVMVGAEGDGTVSRFIDAYRHVSSTVGVSLVDETERDKAFRSS